MQERVFQGEYQGGYIERADNVKGVVLGDEENAELSMRS